MIPIDAPVGVFYDAYLRVGLGLYFLAWFRLGWLVIRGL